MRGKEIYFSRGEGGGGFDQVFPGPSERGLREAAGDQGRDVQGSFFGGRRKGPRGRGARNKTPVFGILERKGLVKVTVVKNVSDHELLTYTVKTVRRVSIIYTDKFRSYDSLMFCGYRHLIVDHGKRFAHGKVYINGLEGFWSYAKERLIKFHGVSKEKFPYYLKEMEFRYNNRHHSIFKLLVKSVCNLA